MLTDMKTARMHELQLKSSTCTFYSDLYRLAVGPCEGLQVAHARLNVD